MKELSTEQKAKRYNEVLEKARKELQTCGSTDCEAARQIFRFFPELKENEDERIVKCLLNYFNHVRYNELDLKGTDVDEVIAWLEEQGKKDKLIQELGEYKVKYIQETLGKALTMNNKDDERLRKTTIAFLKEFADKGYENAIECIDWLEKQGEQNYKIIKGKNYLCVKTHNYAGVEWIKGTKYYASDDYTLVNQGCECYCPEYSKEEHNNLFEEVKYEGCVEKQGKQKSTDVEEVNFFDDFRKTDSEDEPKFHEDEWITNGDYTWKIVDVKPLDYILQSQDGNIVDDTISHVDEQFHSFTIQDAKDGDVLVCKGDIKGSNGIKYERICLFKNLDSAFFTLTKTSNYIEEYDIDVNIDYPDNTVPATKEQKEILFMAMSDAGYTFDFEKKELIEESKNIKNQIMSEITDLVKDCITPKPAEWSEEDEDMLYKTISVINRLCAEGKEYVWSINTLKKLFYWLKSLKNKYTWKPSDGQMDSITCAVRQMKESACYDSELVSLYQDLKKLKEE